MGISRRRVLLGLGGVAGLLGLGGAAAALVDAELLPGKSALNEALGRCDAPPPMGPRGSAVPPVTGSFHSAARGRDVGFAISYPPGQGEGSALPVCLALHGYGGNARAAIDCGSYASFIAGAVAAGAAPFALAAADGGDTYWHPHADDDPLTMLIDEFLPLLETRGLLVDRLAITGWSMGGYGALLAGLTYRDRFRAIVATSPAIFHSYGDAEQVNPAAFDSQEEWARYDVTARAGEFAGMPVRIVIGASDSFVQAVRELQQRLPDPAVVEIVTGCHDDRVWSHAAPAQVQAISAVLGRG